MKYVIQIFRPSGSTGHWENTIWGCDDFEKVTATANKIAEGNKMGFTKVRIMEVITELICKNVQEPS